LEAELKEDKKKLVNSRMTIDIPPEAIGDNMKLIGALVYQIPVLANRLLRLFSTVFFNERFVWFLISYLIQT